MYIANPFGVAQGKPFDADRKSAFGQSSESGPGFLAKLFMTHPPVQERMQRLRGQQ
jgi:Zn-dependent protease with chaperone function